MAIAPAMPVNVTLRLCCLFQSFPAAEYHAGIRLLRPVILRVNTTKSPLSTTLVGFNGVRFLSHSSVSFCVLCPDIQGWIHCVCFFHFVVSDPPGFSLAIRSMGVLKN